MVELSISPPSWLWHYLVWLVRLSLLVLVISLLVSTVNALIYSTLLLHRIWSLDHLAALNFSPSIRKRLGIASRSILIMLWLPTLLLIAIGRMTLLLMLRAFVIAQAVLSQISIVLALLVLLPLMIINSASLQELLEEAALSHIRTRAVSA